MISAIWILLAALVLAGLVLLGFFYFGQEGMIFMPVGLGRDEARLIAALSPRVEEVRLEAPDGVTLHGWFVRSKGEGRAPLLFYFGGNAEEVSTFVPEALAHLGGWNVLLVNYRGYGLSGGRPGERALFGDSELLFDAFSSREGVQGSRIVALGRSLGTGVAVHLAASRPLAGVVLISPYDSLARLARRHYPFLPTGLLLRHRFDSLSLAPSIAVPAFAVVAEEDEIVPPEHSERLMRSWGGRKVVRRVKGAGHNSLVLDEGLWMEIGGFLESL